MVYKEIESENNIWLPEKQGEQIEGIVLERIQGQYGTQLILNVNGKEVKTPSHKVLQSRLDKLMIGDKVRITYKEEVPPSVRGQNPTKIYKVERDEEDEEIEEEKVEE